jgi:polysaccharide pyruvyl transferase WcaK-like protein
MSVQISDEVITCERRKGVIFLLTGGVIGKNDNINIGDHAQLKVALNRLRQIFPYYEFSVISHSKNVKPEVENTQVVFGLINYLFPGTASHSLAYLRAGFNAALLLINAGRLKNGKAPLLIGSEGLSELNSIKRVDALFIPGVGMFSQGYFAGVATIWAIYVKLVAMLGKPVIINANQIGPFETRWAKGVTRWALTSAETIGVREIESYEEAIKLGLPKDKLVITGDEAWRFPAATQHEFMDLRQKLSLPDRYIVAQIRFDKGTGWTDADAVIIAATLDVLSNEFDLPVVFVSFHHTDNKNPDIDSARSISKHMTVPTHLVENKLDGHCVKAICGNAELAIGVSNHFCVFCASEATPTIALHKAPYLRHKLVGLARLWPSMVAAVDYNGDFSPNKTLQIAQELLNNAPKSKEACFPSVPIDPDAAYQTLKQVLDK